MPMPPSMQPEYRQAYRREWSKRIRIQALLHYGGQCFCCGELRPEFLAIDHINGGGSKHRKELREGSKRCGSIHYWLKKNNWPIGFRVACHNCNSALGFYGYCPHETERQRHLSSVVIQERV